MFQYLRELFTSLCGAVRVVPEEPKRTQNRIATRVHLRESLVVTEIYPDSESDQLEGMSLCSKRSQKRSRRVAV